MCDFFHDVLPCSKTPPTLFCASRDYFMPYENVHMYRIRAAFLSLFLHRAPRYDPAYQQQSSPLAAAACISMRVRLLLL